MLATCLMLSKAAECEGPASFQSKASLVLTCASALVAWFLLDALLFRTCFYITWLKPETTLGIFGYVLRREQRAQRTLGDNLVATVGDSRFVYNMRIVNGPGNKTGLVFRNAGVWGSNPKAWYYLLRELDPHANRYRAVVLGLTNYEDEDLNVDTGEDQVQLRYVLTYLSLSDAFDFASTYHRRDTRFWVLRDALFRGFALQPDIHDFLEHPRRRIDVVRLYRDFDRWIENHEETDSSMSGLKIDWANWSAQLPPGFADEAKTVEKGLMRRPAPQQGRMAAFRRFWFGRILERYRESRTKVIFLRLARGPIQRPDFLKRGSGSTVHDLARDYPNAALVGEHAFDSLEDPANFGDGTHLNRAGANRFAEMLPREIAGVLAEGR